MTTPQTTPDITPGTTFETATPETPAETTYTPVFNDTVRTAIYIVTLVAGLVGLGVSAFGDPQIGAYISSAAGIIAAAFGVTYSPVRMAKLR